MNLGSYFDRAVLEHADRIALIDGDTSLTYRRLGERTTSLANALCKLGLKKGERAALLLPNCHQAVEIDAALFKTGIIKVPLNARVSTGELGTMIADCGVTLLFTHGSLAEIAVHALEGTSNVRHVVVVDGDADDWLAYDDLLATGSNDPILADVQLDEIYSLNYTSGTTGVLKAAMLTQRNWVNLTRLNLMRTGVETREGTIVGYVAPITHAAGGSIVANLVRGTTNLLLRKFEPDAFLRSVEEHRIAEVLLVPTMIHMLLASPEIAKRDLSSLTSIVYGTAPMAPDRIREALNVFGPILSQGYGQTESGAVTSMLGKYDHLAAHDERIVHRLASAGRPSPGCEVRIVDDEGKDVAVGDVGEIILRGEMVMLGYWNAPELTRETICDGWLHTRDMGRFDEDGYLYLVDRKSDMIITGGFNVYPTEVENVLYQHPAVHEVAVVSVPDPKWGETVKAVVALKPGASVGEDELVQHCRAQLTPYKCPKSVDFVDELPKSPVGKILRRAVKQGYWKNSERLIA